MSATPPPERSSGGKARRVPIAALILLGLVLLFVAPQFTCIFRPQPDGRPVKTLSNLKQVYLCILLYTGDHEGQFPPDLETLIQEGYLKARFNDLMAGPEDSKTFSAQLTYHKPPPTANEVTAPLPPETLLLSYDNEKFYAYVTADGAGKVERKRDKR